MRHENVRIWSGAVKRRTAANVKEREWTQETFLLEAKIKIQPILTENDTTHIPNL